MNTEPTLEQIYLEYEIQSGKYEGRTLEEALTQLAELDTLSEPVIADYAEKLLANYAAGK